MAHRANADLHGALLVDKPPGPTSHDIVAFVRRALQTSRVGHTGTLDPLATGLLVVLVGPATRLAQFLAADEKEYIADVRLGITTPTYDAASLAEGVRYPMTESGYPITDPRHPMHGELEAALARFRGSFLQMPPQFSAKKVAGVAAYEKARKKETVDLKPVPVTVRALEVLHPSDNAGGDLLRLRVAATAGFYVRSLAHDLGQALGCGAHLEALRRTRVGRFGIEEALTLDQVEVQGAAALLPLNALLGHMPAVVLSEDGARRAVHGNALSPHHTKNGDSHRFSQITVTATVFVRLVGPDESLIAIAEARPDGLLHPIVVLG